MASKRTTIIGWTGGGRLEDLRASAAYVLMDRRIRGRPRTTGAILTVEGPEPLSVAEALRNLPGVAWVAAGGSGGTPRELAAVARRLASVYVGRGDGFNVLGEGPSAREASDLTGGLTSTILDTVKGSRVSMDSPNLIFRASFDGRKGAVGVEVVRGPGGIPTANGGAACLVSGGVHSSVMAWFAVLQGMRVTLVHAESGEGRLRAVAALYSELSYRADPRWLSLEVIGRASVHEALANYASRSKLPVYAGFSRTGEGEIPSLPGVAAPLYLMPQEQFQREFDGLGLRASESETDWNERGGGHQSRRKFGGRRADISEVLDGLGRHGGGRP